MPEKKPQTRDNHTRLDPWFHFFLFPLSAALMVAAAIQIPANPLHGGMFRFLEALCVTGSVLLCRVYSLRVQDRVIRLEERLRLASLLSPGDSALANALTESQLVALRFASDSEAPALALRAVNENLTSKQIKQEIREWRPDYWRV